MSYTDRICSTAAALDFLGDTWSILLVGDLLRHGPQTTGRLQRRNEALDPVEVDVRLRHLCAHGLVEVADDGIEPRYRLTRLGRAAEPVIRALDGFGDELVHRRPLTVAMLTQLIADTATDRYADIDRLDVAGRIGLDVSGRSITVLLAPAIMRAEPADAQDSLDALVRCTQDVFVDLVTGAVTFDEAAARHELIVHGDIASVRQLFRLVRTERASRVASLIDLSWRS